jgi:hypothetical protein
VLHTLIASQGCSWQWKPASLNICQVGVSPISQEGSKMKVKFDYLFDKLIHNKDVNLKKIEKLLREFKYKKVKENKYFNEHMGKAVILNLKNITKSYIYNPRK